MTTTTSHTPRVSLARLILTILLPFSLCYFLSYLYRAVNAVIAPDLVSDIGLDASELGLLTAAYLIGFAGFQIPLGLLLDRFGPRKVQAVLVCVGAVGALLFAFAAGKWGLSFGRMLIGIGSAGGNPVTVHPCHRRSEFMNATIFVTSLMMPASVHALN